MDWKLKFGTTEKTFADWGFGQLHRRTSNFRAEQVSFVEENVAFDQDPKFNFDDEITIKQIDDGKDTVWFIGRITSARRSGDGQSGAERIIYQARGVLSWLDDLIFRMAWKYLTDKNDPDSDKFTVYLADLVLFQKLVGFTYEIATVKEQVQEIFSYLVSKFGDTPKLQLDDSRLPTHQAPFMEVSNITCEMALEYSLRTCPDVAVWADYSTDIPTIKIARRGTAQTVAANPDNYLTAVTLTVPDEGEGSGNNVVSVDIQARDELKVPAVDISYRQINSINGVSAKYIVDDIWPLGSDVTGFRVIPQVVNLEGTNLQYPTETLAVRSISKDDKEWWKLHDSSLAKSNIRNLVIREAQRDGALPYEILPNSGAWAPWMGGHAEEDVIQCYADWDRYETKGTDEILVERIQDQLLTVRVMTTDKPSGTYFGQATGSVGEPLPFGMAQALYEATSETHYDGTIVLEEEECTGSVMVGNVVNIKSSRRPEWATMRAMVQEVEEDVDNGRTTITVGPPKFLGVQEIMDWIRGLRNSNTGLWASRASGVTTGSGPLQVASRAHKETLSGGKQTRERLVLMRSDSQGIDSTSPDSITARIELDVRQCFGKVLQVREIAVCDNGVTKYMLGLFSEVYATPLSPH